MGKKALYGALMGMGEGISQYGGVLTADELRKAAANETFDRQTSLQEIRQRFQIEFRGEEREYQSELLADKHQREEDMMTPGNPLYEMGETQRQKMRGEGQEDDLAKIRERNKIYGGGNSASIRNTEFYKALSDADKEIYDHVNKISEKGVLTQAQRDKYVLDLYANFSKQGKYDQNSTVKNLGIDPKLTGTDLRDAIITQFRSTVDSVAGPKPTTGLMNPGNSMSPGSGPNNPIDVTTISSPPPPGTWVRLPDGRIEQMP